jgi:hypothetical protein
MLRWFMLWLGPAGGVRFSIDGGALLLYRQRRYGRRRSLTGAGARRLPPSR